MKNFTLLLFMIYFTIGAFAQNVGINTSTPNPNAALDIESTDKGIMVPRLTTAQRTTLGATLGTADESILVYDKDETQFYFWDGVAWSTDADRDPNNEIQDISLSGTELSISDGLFTRAMDELNGTVKFVDSRNYGHYRHDYYTSVVLTEDGCVMTAGAPQYGKTGQGDDNFFRYYYELINFN